MRLALNQCRKRLGEPDQRKGIRRYRTRRPDWMTPDLAVRDCHAYQERLLQRGQVVWAALVMANNMIFKPGREDLWGMIVYSADPRIDRELSLLMRVAKAMNESRDQAGRKETLPRDMTYIARVLADASEPLFQHAVPQRLSDGIPVFLGALLFPRRHLPNRILNQDFFPVLIDPTRHRSVCLLPWQFWPEYLLDYSKPHWSAA